MEAAGKDFTAEFKAEVVQRMLAGESVSELSREVKVKRQILYRWRDAYRKEGGEGLARPRGRPRGPARRNPPASPPAGEERIRALGAQGGAAGVGDRFFAKSLQASQGVTPAEQSGWRDSIYGEIEAMMQLAGLTLSIEEACRTAPVSRAGYYRLF